MKLRLWPCCAWARSAVFRSLVGAVIGLGSRTDRPHLPPGLYSGPILVRGASRRRRPPRLGPGQLAAHLRSGLGWEVAGGAAWDVQSDGQLLQLVQAVAGARQVGWSRLAGCLPRGGGQLRPKGRTGRRLSSLSLDESPRPQGMLSLPL